METFLEDLGDLERETTSENRETEEAQPKDPEEIRGE